MRDRGLIYLKSGWTIVKYLWRDELLGRSCFQIEEHFFAALSASSLILEGLPFYEFALPFVDKYT